MLLSFRVRILIALGCILLLSAGSVSYFAQTHVQDAVLKSADEHSMDLMDAIALTIENEYHSLEFHRQNSLERRKNNLRDLVAIAMSHLVALYDQVQRGELSEPEAKKEALRRLKKLRYGDGVGYFWVNDLSEPVPHVLMHPEQEEGGAFSDEKYYRVTNNQQHLLVVISELIHRDHEGFVHYRWNKPTENGSSEEQPKLSYVREFSPWQWVVGTGVYLDDVEAEVQQRLDEILVELRRAFSQVHMAGGNLYLFSGDGQTLVHSVRTNDSSSPVIPDVEKMHRAARTPDIPVEHLWVQPQSVDTPYHDRAYVHHFEPLDWYIVSSLSLDTLAKPGKRLRTEILRGSIVVLLMASVIAYVLSFSLTRPLVLLSNAARRIEHTTDTEVPIPVCGPRETQELGRVLQKMLSVMTGLLADKQVALESLLESNDNLLRANEQLAREMAERKEVQQALINNERKYRTLFKCTSDAIILADLETYQVFDSNQAAELLFGYQHDEFLGMSPEQLSPMMQDDGSDSRSKAQEKINRLFEYGNQFFEWTHEKKSGERFQAEVHLSLMPLDDRHVILAVLRDVTQRKIAETALVNALQEAESSRDKIDAILKAISDGLMVVDHSGQILLINHTARQWLNLPETDILGQHVSTVIVNRALTDFICSILDGEKQIPRREVELQSPAEMGHRLVDVQITSVQNDDKALSDTLVLLRDITRERELDQLKNEFISSAAHELNTPLTIIMGFAELLVNREYRQSISLEQQQDFLETICLKGEELTSIVDDLLKLEQLEFGQSIQLQKVHFDLQHDMLNLIKEYEESYPDDHFEADISPCMLWADREKINQVLDNILNNAVKFSPSGASVHVDAKVVNDEVVIRIADQGIGMDKENIRKVFDTFFRIDGSTTSKGGLGLGLTVAKSIIDAHHGSIRVESELDQGTTVILTLPCQNNK
nr:cache domain-containing protein [uncultured Desulfuromonas sp.]